MDYEKHYRKLIETRIGRKRKRGEYYEKHHIVPKCWGGGNKKENIIHLTAREHFIAHWLLYRMRPWSNRISLAFWYMNHSNSNMERIIVSSRTYSESKEALAEANRRLNTGRVIEEKHLVKWRKNKNNSKKIINTVTGEIRTNAKQLWREKYQDQITYSAFAWNMKRKGNTDDKTIHFNSKLKDLSIYDWKYC